MKITCRVGPAALHRAGPPIEVAVFHREPARPPYVRVSTGFSPWYDNFCRLPKASDRSCHAQPLKPDAQAKDARHPRLRLRVLKLRSLNCEAVAANSLGRQPKVGNNRKTLEPRSGGRLRNARFCRRFAARAIMMDAFPWADAQGYSLMSLRDSRIAQHQNAQAKSVRHPNLRSQVLKLRSLGFQPQRGDVMPAQGNALGWRFP